MHIKGYHREITAAHVDEIGKRLLAAKAMHEREIALGQRAAAALEPIRHFRKIDIRAIRRVRENIDDCRASISYTKNPSYAYILRPEYLHFGVGQGYQQRDFTQINVRVDINANMAELITALQACDYSREQLGKVKRQFEQMEELLDAEEHIRDLVRQIEETRTRLAVEVLGADGSGWQDILREHLPALTGGR